MDTVTDRCQECGTPLPVAARVGRPRRYCSASCRSAARRARRRAESAGGTALPAGPCATDIAGHRCGRAARFAITLSRRETRLCGPCHKAAIDFLIGQGVTARDIRAVPLTGPEPQPDPVPATPAAPSARHPVGRPLRPARVLLIEDDDALRDVLRMVLTRGDAYLVSSARDGETGLRAAYTQRPDLVLLDIMLPGIDGIEVLRRLRGVSDVPVIFLTARSDSQDLVIGLAAGADDYIVKPFDVNELKARIARVLRRHQVTESRQAVYEDGLLRLNSLTLEAHVVGEPLALTPTEFRLLNQLVRFPGAVQPFGQLLAAAWNDPGGRGANRVKFMVSRLRRKLDATPLGSDAIASARGIGYFYRPPVSPPPPADPRTPPAGHGHAGRILDLLNTRERAT
ncbi:response regulator transcription factor [Streptomyces profundus]|uniref:response regulator transcription factor n=1 Tax=Streptomyces profundus TaxID=2867410 RepID=UPI001D1622BF|nr:response regulator transcription factor [Streptomyces sp. MA3_2.13]UED85063.1 response regulator transcription factor [Streptomyces sp. MA3_2.13]